MFNLGPAGSYQLWVIKLLGNAVKSEPPRKILYNSVNSVQLPQASTSVVAPVVTFTGL